MILESYLKEKVCEDGRITNIASFFLLLLTGLGIAILGLCVAGFFLPCIAVGCLIVAAVSPLIGCYVAFKYILKKIARRTCWDQKQQWSLCHVRTYIDQYIMRNTIAKAIFHSVALIGCSILCFLFFSGYFAIKVCINMMRCVAEGFMAPFTLCISLCRRKKRNRSSVLQSQEENSSIGEQNRFLLGASSILSTSSSKTSKKRSCKPHNVIVMEGAIKNISSKRAIRSKPSKVVKPSVS